MRALLLVLFGVSYAGRLAGQTAASPPPLAIDVTRLVARHDSFAVRVKGVALGYIKDVLEPTASGFRYSETSSIGGLVEQATILELDSRATMKSVRQHGLVQGQTASIEVNYDGSRVTGSASTTAPEGLKTVAIDTTVSAGTLDDSAIQAVLPALALAAGAEWSIPVFSAAANELRVTTLKVTSIERTEGDAGSVETYKVEWSGTVQPTTFWVTTELPHRIARIAIAGAPIEIVRINERLPR